MIPALIFLVSSLFVYVAVWDLCTLHWSAAHAWEHPFLETPLLCVAWLHLPVLVVARHRRHRHLLPRQTHKIRSVLRKKTTIAFVNLAYHTNRNRNRRVEKKEEEKNQHKLRDKTSESVQGIIYY
jgi:hypothetical protein